MATPIPRPRRSLSRRLLLITSGAVLCVEFLFFVPALTQARLEWLQQRAIEAQLAALSASAAPDGVIDLKISHELLRLSGTEGIQLQLPNRVIQVLGQPQSSSPIRHINLDKESFVRATLRSFALLTAQDDALVEMNVHSMINPDANVLVTFHELQLARYLREFAGPSSLYSLIESLLVGLLVYAACDILFVKPMQRMIGSIHRFRADPERTPTLAPEDDVLAREDEMSLAALELSAMQKELRTALWRNARLAAIGTAVAKVSHDLRGVLSPAMLMAERLESNKDPSVSKAGAILVRAVERAVDLVRGPLEFAREEPVAPQRVRVPIRGLLTDLVDQSVGKQQTPSITITCEPDLAAMADVSLLERIFGNLFRNSTDAGCTAINVSVQSNSTHVEITVTDNATGLPQSVQDNLFKPFNSSGRQGSTGLGLAIVRDLLHAQGGDISLIKTGPDGTAFKLILPIGPQRTLMDAALKEA